MTDQSMDERVSALEEKLNAQEQVLKGSALMLVAIAENAMEQGEKDDASFEEVGKILENHKTSIETLAKTGMLRQEGIDTRLQELADALNGVEEQVEFISMSLDETDDVAETNVDEMADAIETIRANVNLMANGLVAYIKHHTDLHEFISTEMGGMGEALSELSADFYDPEDTDDGLGIFSVSDDEDGVVVVTGAGSFEDLADELPEEPDATIMRLNPADFDEEISADDVPMEAIETMLEIQADAVGVMSLEFDGDNESREDVLDAIFGMLDEAMLGGGYDDDLITDFRALIEKGGLEFMTQATHMAPPGFISASLGMMAEAEIGAEPGVYLVALSDTQDLLEVCAALYLINCAKSNVLP